MKLPQFQFVQAVRSSYWFIPSVMALAAIGLGVLTVWLDSGPADGLLEPIGWYQASKPEGARAVLSAIAGSMITVAGVVFSITIVAIAFAASQYGPRILTNFMSDRGNQVTLGTFIATFVYSIVVLRTIFGGDNGFVPQLSILVAMVLAVCSIAVLIYFIHHVPQSIHVNNVVARIGRQLISSLEKTFPACFGTEPEHDAATRARLERVEDERFGEGARFAEITADDSGYLEAVDDSSLIQCASRHGLTVRLLRAPGDFLYRGMPFALAWPQEKAGDAAEAELRRSYRVGSRRTPVQDVAFLIDELVEIGARALSTGVNDPYTAITCVDWLAAAAAEMARRQPASPYRLDAQGELRVIAPVGSFREQVERGFGRIRPYVARDVNAATHTLAMLRSLAEHCRSREQLKLVEAEIDGLIALARTKLDEPSLERLNRQGQDARTRTKKA